MDMIDPIERLPRLRCPIKHRLQCPVVDFGPAPVRWIWWPHCNRLCVDPLTECRYEFFLRLVVKLSVWMIVPERDEPPGGLEQLDSRKQLDLLRGVRIEVNRLHLQCQLEYRARQQTERLELFRVLYRQHDLDVACGSVVVHRKVALPQGRPELRLYDFPKVLALQPIQVAERCVKALQSIFGSFHAPPIVWTNLLTGLRDAGGPTPSVSCRALCGESPSGDMGLGDPADHSTEHLYPETAFWEASGSDRVSGYFSLSYSIADPKGAMPCANTVFGNSPEPQIVKDPKSLYQSPSGAHGPVFTQSCNRRRSCWEICRSATRARMCCQTGRGRLENRIFGNGILPEDCPDQILPGFILAHGIALRHEPPICRIETLACRRFSVYPALCEHDQRPAHGETLSSGYSLDLNRQVRWNRDALADGWRGSRTSLWAVSHTFIISSAPQWCRECQIVSGSSATRKMAQRRRSGKRRRAAIMWTALSGGGVLLGLRFRGYTTLPARVRNGPSGAFPHSVQVGEPSNVARGSSRGFRYRAG